MDQAKRNNILRACERALNTPDGKLLMQEIQDTLDPYTLGSDKPTRVVYLAGQRDAYKFIERLASGEYLRGETDV